MLNLDTIELAPLDSKVVYAPVGYCIYCFADSDDLTDEHAVPQGFGGRHIIPKASCRKCQKIINEEFETYCMRTLMGLARQKYGMKSPNKRPPPRPSVTIIRKNTKAQERIHKPLNELPTVVNLPAFPPPTILNGFKLPRRFRGGHWAPFLPSREFLDSVDAESILTEEISPRKLARQLAKIAHCMAFAVFGFGAFEPMLPDLIIGDRVDFIELVGGSLKIMPPEEGRSIFLGLRPFVRFDGTPFLICDIRFFAFLGGPLYSVVVGEIRDGDALRSFESG